MRRTKTFQILTCALAAMLGLSAAALAVPYASSVQNTGGNSWEFILNQGADSVTIVRDGGNAVVMNNAAAGIHSFDMTGYSNYEIKVSHSAAAGWTQISDDNLIESQYYSPRGVAVNQNAASSNFGRIYVSEGIGDQVATGARFTTDGIYVMGADQSDILSQLDLAADGGVDWSTSGNSPYKISIAPDDSIYIADWSDTHSGVWRAPADLSGTWPNVLANDFCDDSGFCGNHGSIPSVWVEGTGADTVLYTLDEDFDLGGSTGSILRYDIGTATDYSDYPIEQTSDTSDIILNLRADFVRDEDDSWWITQYRWTESAGAPSLVRFEDGGVEPVYNSGRDDNLPLLAISWGSIDIQDDLDMLVLGARNDAGIYIIGISDPENPVLLETIAHGGNVQDVAFDSAGNLYVVNNSTETLRIFSPGGDWLATTSSDGTFDLSVLTNLYRADFNGDGAVDGDDFLIWQGSFNTDDGGDANGDGVTDGNDFLIWQEEFGSGGEAASAVPEPASVILLLAALAGALLVTRRR